MVKVNLGSGYWGLDDWLNYDNSVAARIGRSRLLTRCLVALRLLPEAYRTLRWPPIILHDCRRGIPQPDDSVDFLYTSHLLEHLRRHETIRLLRECRRVLKPGGTIRIVVPDLEKLVALYLKRDVTAFPALEGGDEPAPTYGDVLSAQFYPYEWNRGVAPTRVRRWQGRFLRPHQWMYNEESLGALLRFTGFVSIERRGYRQSALKDVEFLDMHPEVSLYLEARKGA